jgi:hypothetical protein
LLTLPAAAATRYVTTAGNNGNDGTAADAGHAWATIQNGLNNITGGDTLNIGPGTYDSRLYLANGISGASWGTATTIQGTNVTIGWTTGVHDADRVEIEGHYIILSGLTLDGGSCLTTTTPAHHGFIVSSADAHHVRFTNITVLGPPRGMGILLHDTAYVGGNEILSCTASNQGWGFVSIASGDTFYHPVYIESPNNLVDGCTLGPPGIGARSVDMDTESKPSGVQIFESNYGALTNNVIRNNTINGPCRVGFTICGMPTGSAPAGGNFYYNNTIHDTIYGTWIGFHCGTNRIYNNTFYNVANGIWHNDDVGDDSGGNLIANNIFANVTNFLAYFRLGNTYCKLTNNLVYNCGPVHPGGNVTYTETGRVATDPAFLDAATHDFRLSTFSGARDTGVDLSALFTADRSGTTRTIPWDIGAFELILDNPVLGVAAAINLGTALVGTTNSGTLNVTNTGSGTLAGGFTISPPFYAPVSTYSLGAGLSVGLVVRYYPSAAGSHSQTLTLTGGGGATCDLSGVATNTPANVSSSPASLAFGSIHKTSMAPPQSITLTNTGGTLADGSIGFPTGFAGSTNAFYLVAGGSQQFAVTATPPADATYAGDVTFSGSTDTVEVRVTGTNYPVTLSPSRTSIQYGSVVTNSGGITVTTGVTNTGELTLVGGTAVASGAPFSITSGDAFNLDPGAVASVSTKYDPTSLGPHTGTVTIEGGLSPIVMEVKGNGTAVPEPLPFQAGPQSGSRRSPVPP